MSGLISLVKDDAVSATKYTIGIMVLGRNDPYKGRFKSTAPLLAIAISMALLFLYGPIQAVVALIILRVFLFNVLAFMVNELVYLPTMSYMAHARSRSKRDSMLRLKSDPNSDLSGSVELCSPIAGKGDVTDALDSIAKAVDDDCANDYEIIFARSFNISKVCTGMIYLMDKNYSVVVKKVVGEQVVVFDLNLIQICIQCYQMGGPWLRRLRDAMISNNIDKFVVTTDLTIHPDHPDLPTDIIDILYDPLFECAPILGARIHGEFHVDVISVRGKLYKRGVMRTMGLNTFGHESYIGGHVSDHDTGDEVLFWSSVASKNPKWTEKYRSILPGTLYPLVIIQTNMDQLRHPSSLPDNIITKPYFMRRPWSYPRVGDVVVNPLLSKIDHDCEVVEVNINTICVDGDSINHIYRVMGNMVVSSLHGGDIDLVSLTRQDTGNIELKFFAPTAEEDVHKVHKSKLYKYAGKQFVSEGYRKITDDTDMMTIKIDRRFPIPKNPKTEILRIVK